MQISSSLGDGLLLRVRTGDCTDPFYKDMINGKQFKMVTDKFMSSPTVQNARVQVCLPNGEFYDIKGIQLMENKLFGVRETHRLVITIEPEKWRMGRVLKKV